MNIRNKTPEYLRIQSPIAITISAEAKGNQKDRNLRFLAHDCAMWV